MFKWSILVVVVLFAFAGVTTAQDAATCDLDAARAKAVEELTVIANDDDESLATGLRTVSDDLATAVAACSELHWSGEKDWISEPVTIPAGVYKLIVRGLDDSVGLQATSLTDDYQCSRFHINTSIDNAKDAELERAEMVYASKANCDFIFEINTYSSGHWEFWFERIQ